MGKHDTKDLLKFLKIFPEEIRELVLWLREFAWDLHPESNELIYDNYNAVAFGWSITDKLGDNFCSIAIGRTSHNVHFGFFWGSKIPDPEKRLIGQGNQYRYLLVKNKKDFPKAYAKKLVKSAYDYSFGKMKLKGDSVEGTTIVKSVSVKKRALKLKK